MKYATVLFANTFRILFVTKHSLPVPAAWGQNPPTPTLRRRRSPTHPAMDSSTSIRWSTTSISSIRGRWRAAASACYCCCCFSDELAVSSIRRWTWPLTSYELRHNGKARACPIPMATSWPSHPATVSRCPLTHPLSLSLRNFFIWFLIAGH